VNEFIKGRKVRAKHDAKGYGSATPIKKGTVLEVSRTSEVEAGKLFNARRPDGGEYALAKADFEAAETDTTPAPLDPSKKAPEPGDTLVWTNSGIEVRVTELTPAAVVFAWSNGAVGQLPWSEWFNYLQPAPKPEWTGPQFGHALVDGQSVHGFLTTHHGDAEYHPVFVFPMPDGGYLQASGEGFSDFVPDETRPTRDALTEALQETARERETRSSFAEDADLILAALLRGESR
jgi:hypothetical protein